MAVKLRVLYTGDVTANSSPTAVQLDAGASANKGWLIASLTIFNTAASGSSQVDVYVAQASGTNTYLYKAKDLAGGDFFSIKAEIALNHPSSSPDKIWVRGFNGSTSQVLNCVAMGVERDQ